MVDFFSNGFAYKPEAFILVFIFTLIFSIPGMFIFWIVLLANWHKELLFRLLLKAGFFISVLSSLVLYMLPDDVVKNQQFFLSVSIVIASIASIMIHYTIIISISTDRIPESETWKKQKLN